MIKKTIVENFKLSDLIPYEKNYQSHKNNLEHIKNSLKDFGYSKVSIGFDENNVLIYGHGTLQALKEIGEDSAPFVMRIEGMSETMKRALRIADNASGKAAEMILENLKIEFEEINFEYNLFNYGLNINFDETTLDEKEQINKDKKYLLEIETPNETDMNEIYRELLDRGYIVKVKNV
jgi:hypothetical protein